MPSTRSHPLPFSNEDTITLAACHTCCALPGEPCKWSGPGAHRAQAARKSHPDRVIRAKKIHGEGRKEVDNTIANI